MTEILQIFSGNPLSTFIGKKIEAATRPELDSDDWALNLEICDLINESDDDAKDAIRAIKKRLQQIEQDRNFMITNRTLTVLETCVSNCSRRFHVLVMTKDFIQDLVKLIGPKNNPPVDLQERVLRLIERWADAFRNQPDLGGVVAVYNDLKAKGVTFPPKDPSSNVPIQTPQRSVPVQHQQPPSPDQTTRSSLQQSQSGGGGQVVLEGQGYNKISQDLGVVQSSINMFNELMQLLESKSDESDWKLASDLNSTCRQMKDRIVNLIEQVANEDLTIELLRLNDDLNNAFTRYDRLLKNRSKTSSAFVDQQASTGTEQGSRTNLSHGTSGNQPVINNRVQTESQNRPDNAELSLIDFNASEESAAGGDKPADQTVVDPFDSSHVAKVLSKQTPTTTTPLSGSSNQAQQQTEPLAAGLNKLSLSSDRQQQQSAVEAKTAADKKATGLPEEISSVREQDFTEIENWLSTDSGRNLASISADMPSIEPISIPNSEFENFIASRALAGSSVPSSSEPKQPPSHKKPEPSV